MTGIHSTIFSLAKLPSQFCWTTLWISRILSPLRARVNNTFGVYSNPWNSQCNHSTVNIYEIGFLIQKLAWVAFKQEDLSRMSRNTCQIFLVYTQGLIKLIEELNNSSSARDIYMFKGCFTVKRFSWNVFKCYLWNN